MIANAVTQKLGPEEITRDIPNVGEDSLKRLRRRWNYKNWCRSKTRRYISW